MENEEKVEKFIPRKNLLKIEGEGKSVSMIAEEYADLIREDYNVTVDEICEFLRVSKAYWNDFKLEIKHILITSRIRLALKVEIDDEYRILAQKKVLYSREDFIKYILKNFKVTKIARRINMDLVEKYADFDLDMYHRVMNSAESFGLDDLKNPRKIDIEINDFNSIDLMDYKDIMNFGGYKHSTQAYSLIKNCKLDKYTFGNLVRYNKKDIEENSLVMPYGLFRDLNKSQLLKWEDEQIFEHFLTGIYKNFPDYLEQIKREEELAKLMAKLSKAMKGNTI